MFYSEYCFFDPKTNTIIDFLGIDNDLTQINKENLDQVKLRFPSAIKIKADEAIKIKEDNLRSQPEEISQERYDEMLNILPPVGFTTDDISQSFKLSECLSGSITTIYCQYGAKYYSFNDRITLKHHQIKKIVADNIRQ